MEAANIALPTLIEAHNARFAIAPADTEGAHCPYAGEPATLARNCAIHNTRELSKDLVLSFCRQRYIIQTGGAPRYALRRAYVTIVTYADGRIEPMHGNEVLPAVYLVAQTVVTTAVDDKTLNVRVDAVLSARR
jgi:hypothetical protein